MDKQEAMGKVQEFLAKSEMTTSIPNSEIEKRLDIMAKFSVTGMDAVRSVVNYFLKEFGLGAMKSFTQGTAEDSTIADARTKGKWVNLKVQVARLFESENEKISQSGIIGDETGSISFVAWEKSKLPEMEQGKSYEIKNAIIDEYNGRFSAKLNKTTEILEIDEEITAVQPEVSFQGAVVGVQGGSGLIKRCPICKRALAKGVCPNDHGKVEGTYDLRIKAVVDNGTKAQEILIKRELTEKILGMTLDEARDMAMEALDTSIVATVATNKLVGKYVNVTGVDMGRTIFASSFEFMGEVTKEEVNSVVAEVDGC
jgi:replication factor A1